LAGSGCGAAGLQPGGIIPKIPFSAHNDPQKKGKFSKGNGNRYSSHVMIAKKQNMIFKWEESSPNSSENISRLIFLKGHTG